MPDPRVADLEVRVLVWCSYGMRHGKAYPEGYIESILDSVRSVAVVGASPDPMRPSHEVMEFLIASGYEIIPVNPKAGVAEILGRKVFPSLAEVGSAVDMVDVFRKSDALLGVAEQAIAAHGKVLWAQIGVADPKAALLAEEAGLKVVMNRCPKIELKRMGR